MTQGPSDKTLIEAAVAGDGDSFTELCHRYYASMVAIGHAILGDRHLAEDAAQQGFAKAALKLPNLKKPDKFGLWLAAICRNAARDVARANRGFHCVNKSATQAPEPNRSEIGPAVRAALTQLGPKGREVLYLRYYDGLSYERISQVLGISEQAINGRLRRAKKKLAERLRRDGFDEVQT